MIYLGYFSFDEVGVENEDRHGYFTCALEVKNAEDAVNQFKEYILSLKETAAFFRGVVAVYIEDIVEILKVPTNPILWDMYSLTWSLPLS